MASFFVINQLIKMIFLIRNQFSQSAIDRAWFNRRCAIIIAFAAWIKRTRVRILQSGLMNCPAMRQSASDRAQEE